MCLLFGGVSIRGKGLHRYISKFHHKSLSYFAIVGLDISQQNYRLAAPDPSCIDKGFPTKPELAREGPRTPVATPDRFLRFLRAKTCGSYMYIYIHIYCIYNIYIYIFYTYKERERNMYIYIYICSFIAS